MTKKKQSRAELFAREYVKDLNGQRAAEAAGYSRKTARSQASRLLTKDNVKRLLADLQASRFADVDFSANKVLSELCKMAFSNILDYVSIQDGQPYINLTDVTREQAAAIQEITTDSYVQEGEDDDGSEGTRVVTKTKFKLADKRGSLELLGKHLKLFVDRTEVTGKDGDSIQIISHLPRPKRDGRAA